MASETTTADPELLQTQVAQLLVQPFEAASVVGASPQRVSVVFHYRRPVSKNFNAGARGCGVVGRPDR